jgi:hypothetical protein
MVGMPSAHRSSTMVGIKWRLQPSTPEDVRISCEARMRIQASRMEPDQGISLCPVTFCQLFGLWSMKSFALLLFACFLLLASCQPDPVGPIEPDATPKDTVKNGYRLSYVISSSDSLEVTFSFLNADTATLTEFAIRFGDSTVSGLFDDDTSLTHAYAMRSVYVAMLMGRSDASQPWQYISDTLVELGVGHPTFEQLVACKFVELTIRADIKTNHNGHPSVSKQTLSNRWEIADLGGAALLYSSQSKDGDNESSQKVQVTISDDGARLAAVHNSYHRYVEGSGYGETERVDKNIVATFYSEDSASYRFRAAGWPAVHLVSFYRTFESRFESIKEQLSLDSVSPFGEVVFYK